MKQRGTSEMWQMKGRNSKMGKNGKKGGFGKMPRDFSFFGHREFWFGVSRGLPVNGREKGAEITKCKV